MELEINNIDQLNRELALKDRELRKLKRQMASAERKALENAKEWEDAMTDLKKAKQNAELLYRQEMQTSQKLNDALKELQETQMQLLEAEKITSLGQLVDGLAYELNNPINFVYNGSYNIKLLLG